MMNNVKLVRLHSGEELLCTLIAESSDGITIEDITVIIPTQDRNIGLAPWMPYAETDGMFIKKDYVAFIIEPVEQLAEQYRSIHSRIITPTQKIVT